MLQIHTYKSLTQQRSLVETMFKDRAAQFDVRLAWDVNVNSAGYEVDEFDCHETIYLIWVDEHGQHCGSLRLRSTARSNMLERHFSDHFEQKYPGKATTWEVTRFVISPKIGQSQCLSISFELVKSAFLFALENNISELVGLCFPSMLRVYRRIGCLPDEVSVSTLDRSILLTKWDVDFKVLLRLLKSSRSRIPSNLVVETPALHSHAQSHFSEDATT